MKVRVRSVTTSERNNSDIELRLVFFDGRCIRIFFFMILLGGHHDSDEDDDDDGIMQQTREKRERGFINRLSLLTQTKGMKK